MQYNKNNSKLAIITKANMFTKKKYINLNKRLKHNLVMHTKHI